MIKCNWNSSKSIKSKVRSRKVLIQLWLKNRSNRNGKLTCNRLRMILREWSKIRESLKDSKQSSRKSSRKKKKKELQSSKKKKRELQSSKKKMKTEQSSCSSRKKKKIKELQSKSVSN